VGLPTGQSTGAAGPIPFTTEIVPLRFEKSPILRRGEVPDRRLVVREDLHTKKRSRRPPRAAHQHSLESPQLDPRRVHTITSALPAGPILPLQSPSRGNSVRDRGRKCPPGSYFSNNGRCADSKPENSVVLQK
jgi:hypothetical protein